MNNICAIYVLLAPCCADEDVNIDENIENIALKTGNFEPPLPICKTFHTILSLKLRINVGNNLHFDIHNYVQVHTLSLIL